MASRRLLNLAQDRAVQPAFGSTAKETFSLPEGYARTCQERHSSSHYAKADGTIVVWDIETSGVARKLRGHTRQIQSLRYAVMRSKVAAIPDLA